MNNYDPIMIHAQVSKMTQQKADTFLESRPSIKELLAARNYYKDDNTPTAMRINRGVKKALNGLEWITGGKV